MRIVAPLVAALLLLAGCLDDDSAVAAGASAFTPDWSELALPFGDDHDHADPLQHAGRTTPNFEVLGRNPLFSDHYAGQSAGGYVCGDAKDTGERRIAAVESRSKVGFALADVSDPAAPVWLGELVMESTYVYDLAVLPGGDHVVLVTRHAEVDGLGSLPPVAPAPARLTWRTPCAAEPRTVPWLPDAAASVEDPVPRPMSVVLVDISDPAAPAIVDQHPILGYGHSAYAQQVGEQTLLLVPWGRPRRPGRPPASSCTRSPPRRSAPASNPCRSTGRPARTPSCRACRPTWCSAGPATTAGSRRIPAPASSWPTWSGPTC